MRGVQERRVNHQCIPLYFDIDVSSLETTLRPVNATYELKFCHTVRA